MFGIDPKYTLPGRRASARSIEGMRAGAEGLARERPGRGLQGIDTPSGRLDHKAGPEAYHARLTGASPPYSFAEVYGVAGPALWATMPRGRSGSKAYPLNGTTGLNNVVVEVHPVGAGAWHWFQWSSKSDSTGGTTTVTIPSCFCDVPATLAMTSYDPNCNYGMFQSCTIQYGPTPAMFSAFDLPPNTFLSTQGFPDRLANGSVFYYYLGCQYNQFYLSRLYPSYIDGEPFHDSVLYSWLVGGYGNTCEPFHLDDGMAFPGSDSSCFVTIDG